MKRPLGVRALTLCLLFASLSGCATRTTRAIPPTGDPAPAANSPVGAVRLLEWSWEHMEASPLDTLLTCDYVFVFASADSAGNQYRDRPWTLLDELICTRNMFMGSPALPAASRISVALDSHLIDTADPRPGKAPRWHRLVRTRYALEVESEPLGTYQVSGFASFYVVRGDSACFDTPAMQRGMHPDSTRWWIQRWEDEGPPAVASATSSRMRSWGSLKALWR